MQKISVIIPVYNSESYLNECIDSLLNQSYSDFEVIIIDDGSTDHSYEIIDMYRRRDNRIKLIRQDNQGAAVARNKGLDQATGSLITFIDSDDFIREDTFEKICKYFQDDEELDLVEYPFCGINDLGKLEKEQCHVISNIYIEGERDILKNLISENISSVVWNKVFRKRLIQNFRFKELSIGEDRLFMVEIASKIQKMKQCREGLYFYRYNISGLCRTAMTHKKLRDNLYSLLFLWERALCFKSLSREAFSLQLFIICTIVRHFDLFDWNSRFDMILSQNRMKRKYFNCLVDSCLLKLGALNHLIICIYLLVGLKNAATIFSYLNKK